MSVCSGKVYAVGGHDGNEHLGSMEVFDPLTNKWMMKASMNTKRRGIALASLGGPIYAIGGLDDNTCFSDVERYDIDSDRWSTVASMNTPRGGVGSVALVVSHCFLPGCGQLGNPPAFRSCFHKAEPKVLNKMQLVALSASGHQNPVQKVGIFRIILISN